jgi:hypothetical protein
MTVTTTKKAAAGRTAIAVGNFDTEAWRSSVVNFAKIEERIR